MILNFTFATDRKTIRVSAPEAELTYETRNLVGYHVSTKQIVSIGDTAEEMRANAPAFWEQHGKKIEFVHPFNFEEVHPQTGTYEPLMAVRIIQHFSNKAFGRMKRQSFGRMLVSPWVDRVDYDLQLAGFDKLPVPVRREFVKHLKKLLVAVRRIKINGETVAGRA